MRSILFLLGVALLPAAACADGLDAARAAVAEAQASVASVSVRRFADCPPGESTRRALGTDASGQVRTYEDDSSSGDARLVRRHFYDLSGRLRAAEVEARAANGARREFRLFLDPAGQVLVQSQRLFPGPGWTFPDFWDAADLVRDPRRAFSASSDCRIAVPA